jgi:hypothetical protein
MTLSRITFGKIALAWGLFLWCAGDDTTEYRLAHSHSTCREGDHHGLIRSIRHCHSNRSGELFQQGMAACSNGPKQVCIRHLDEPRNLCWRVFTRTLGYASVSFALTSFR